MMTKWIARFVKSAGALLLAGATLLWVTAWNNRQLALPADPIFSIPLGILFGVGGAVAGLAALICLFGSHREHQLIVLAWLMTNAGAYRVALLSYGVPGLKGFLVNFSGTFGLPAAVGARLAEGIVVVLLLGTYLSLLAIRLQSRSRELSGREGDYLKMSCSACGGHISFPSSRMGETILCPHCATDLTLRTSGLGRMKAS